MSARDLPPGTGPAQSPPHVPKRAAIFAYETNALSAAGIARFERHLASCETCRAACAETRLLETLKAEARSTPSVDLDWTRVWDRISARIEESDTSTGTALGAELLRPIDEVSEREASDRERAENTERPRAENIDRERAKTEDRKVGASLGSAHATERSEKTPSAYAGELRVIGRRRRWALASGAVLLAAAVVAFAVMTSRAGPPPGSETQVADESHRNVSREDAPAPVVLPAPRIGVITAVAGSPEAGLGEELRVAQAGAALPVGSRVRTSHASELHARLAPHTGIVIGENTVVTLVASSDASTLIELASGRLTAKVERLPRGSFVVRSLETSVVVHGTHFAVERDGAITTVILREGVVEVKRNEVAVTTLHAPATWRSDGTTVADAEIAMPAGLDPVASAYLGLRDVSFVRAWRVEGTQLTATNASVVVAPGRHELFGIDARGRTWSTFVDVGPDGVTFTGTGLRPLFRTEGTLPREQIEAVVRRGVPALQRCYDQALRVNRHLSAEVRLRLRVGLIGDVEDVTVIDQPTLAASTFGTCIGQQVRSWGFPPPQGGRVTFELPLRFRRPPR